MSAVVFGAVLFGVDAALVSVEVDLLRRLPSVVIVGLPSPSVREAAERVRSAILASGMEFPRARVVISLAPADLRKEGTGFDLPMALAILAAGGRVDRGAAGRWVVAGELSLAGELRPIRGSLAITCAARDAGFHGVILPWGNGPEAALVSGVDVRVARTLREVIAFLDGVGELPLGCAPDLSEPRFGLDLAEVQGQASARLALEVAAAGGHNMLLEGPPGCGKTMLAARLPGILPALTAAEALECTRIHSAAGLRTGGAGVITQRPFRAPHHSASTAALLGTADLRPGEAALAHRGVLFLDEFPEFRRDAREALRAPLEDRSIVISRAGGRAVFPADFALIAAANPCPCGYLGHPTRACVCPAGARQRYRAHLSGPIVDRIDLRVELEPVEGNALFSGVRGESSADVRARVESARSIQTARNGPGRTNAGVAADEVLAHADATAAAMGVLVEHVDRTGTSARVGRRILRVARTLADIDGAARVGASQVTAAIALRFDGEEVLP
ncbi:MAG: ATP-binding protein [Myxococcales bacterium]|nr:ATP-binding protein [Myxococcales bacterium]